MEQCKYIEFFISKIHFATLHIPQFHLWKSLHNNAKKTYNATLQHNKARVSLCALACSLASSWMWSLCHEKLMLHKKRMQKPQQASEIKKKFGLFSALRSLANNCSPAFILFMPHSMHVHISRQKYINEWNFHALQLKKVLARLFVEVE